MLPCLSLPLEVASFFTPPKFNGWNLKPWWNQDRFISFPGWFSGAMLNFRRRTLQGTNPYPTKREKGKIIENQKCRLGADMWSFPGGYSQIITLLRTNISHPKAVGKMSSFSISGICYFPGGQILSCETKNTPTRLDLLRHQVPFGIFVSPFTFPFLNRGHGKQVEGGPQHQL